MAQPKAAPDLKIPSSQHTVTVSIIDTTGHVALPPKYLMEPPIPGHEELSAVCYAFLIKHENKEAKSKYDTMIFDLGVIKDFENASPKVISESLKSRGVKVSVEKDVHQILKENGEDPDKAGAIIWSHWHWDHTGDPSTFPSSTDLIVGPGFKEAFVPGYPENQESPVLLSAYEGRNLREIDFDTEGKGLMIGQYKAMDFYGDGSFYLLDTPGHAVGHICGLARTSADPPEFLFLGGDIAHHGGEFRPTEYLPLPENITPSPLVAPYTRQAPVCPGSIFEAIHPQKSTTKPFYDPATQGSHKDAKLCKETMDKLHDFDANDNVFVNIAHDSSIYDIIDYFPKTANGWSAKRWKQEGRWRFLRDFDTGSDAHRPNKM